MSLEVVGVLEPDRRSGQAAMALATGQLPSAQALLALEAEGPWTSLDAYLHYQLARKITVELAPPPQVSSPSRI